MSYPQRRMTRSQCARVAAALAKAEETGESSGPQPRPNPNKADSSWISNVIDLKISKRVGDQATTGDEVESMAPGGGRVKPRYVKNHASLTSPRMMNRVQADDPSETTGKESSDVPPKMQVPSKAATDTQAVAPRSESTANLMPPKGRPKKTATNPSQKASPQAQPTNHQSTLPPDETTPESHTTNRQSESTGRDAQSTGPESQSSGRDSQSSGRQSKSSGQRSQSTHIQSQSSGHKAPSASPQEQPTGNHTQSQAPNITSFGLRDEETNSGMQTYETDQDDVDETVSSAEKRKRGPTMGRGLMKAGTCGKKIKIEVDPAIGRPKERVESAKFSSQVGVVARDVLPMVRKWKEIDVQNALDPCIDHMQIHLDVNMDQPGVRQCVIDRLKNSSRQQRYRLHVHYKKFGNVREAKRNKPASVNDQQQWEILCDHFNSPEFQHQSEANSNNRKKMQAKHVTGRTPFTIIQNEISLKNGECDMIELYKFTHENVRGKWSSDEQMNELRDLYAAEGVEKSEQEIVTEVIGRANGYIKGLGYGPKPPGKHSQLQQELEETRAELGVSKTEAATYKSTVNAMNEQLKQQAAQIAKLMAYMESSSSKNKDLEQQTNQNEANQDDKQEGDGQGNEQKEDEQGNEPEDDEQDEDEDHDLSASDYSNDPTM
ncbi:hypothetical protein CASFOL_002013 [Castilleja foliolosa]|uniref:Uncharacterized protein n=1 Tax=Castilleja foliolosa TaxID=1961234 RepID=A0ABD3EDG7_9LAMI